MSYSSKRRVLIVGGPSNRADGRSNHGCLTLGHPGQDTRAVVRTPYVGNDSVSRSLYKRCLNVLERGS